MYILARRNIPLGWSSGPFISQSASIHSNITANLRSYLILNANLTSMNSKIINFLLLCTFGRVCVAVGAHFSFAISLSHFLSLHFLFSSIVFAGKAFCLGLLPYLVRVRFGVRNRSSLTWLRHLQRINWYGLRQLIWTFQPSLLYNRFSRGRGIWNEMKRNEKRVRNGTKPRRRTQHNERNETN